jgi:hypothetical protein
LQRTGAHADSSTNRTAISPAAQRVSQTRKPVRAHEMAFIPQAAMIRIS